MNTPPNTPSNTPATCAFAHDDATYVLGALSPAERLDFERHLATCDACSRSVRSFAGMPGLLDLADARVLEEPPTDPPLPATLLPALHHAVDAGRRRRTVVIAGIAAAAAAIVALAVPMVVHRGDDAPPVTGPGPSNSTTDAGADAETQPMAALGPSPIRATLALEPVTWGTRMLITCTYDTDWVDVELPDAVDYLLYVTTREGRTEQVGSWRSVDDTTMRVPAATSVARDDIATVEVRTSGGRVVLRLDA